MLGAEVMHMARTGQETQDEQATPDVGGVNDVRLRGRLSSAPTVRELPSGDSIVTFRVTVARDPTTARRGRPSGPSSDWVECVVWSARLRRSTLAWESGDRVDLEGALRRRFYRTGTQTATRLEVEVLSGRRVARTLRAQA
jgi:single-strand DNA-binding protein